MSPLEKDFLNRLKQEKKHGLISKCRAITAKNRLCKRTALNLNVGKIPYVGSRINEKLMSKLSGKIRYKSNKCCYLCYQHLGKVIGETIMQNPKYQRKIIEKAIVFFLRSYGVGEYAIQDVKDAFKAA